MKKRCAPVVSPLFVLVLAGILYFANGTYAASVTTYGVSKIYSFIQTTDTNVAPAGINAYVFTAFARPSGPNSIVSGTVTVPSGGTPLALQHGGRAFTYQAGFTSEAQLNKSFPAGIYTLVFVGAGGLIDGSADLTLPDNAYPRSPRITNFAAAQTVDPTKDFKLSWNSFSDAGLQDWVQFVLTDSVGAVLFQSDMLGPNGPLAKTAIGISIPANTLRPGANSAVVTFTYFLGADAGSIPGATAFLLYSTETRFTLYALGGSTGAPTLTNLVHQQDGTVTFQVKAQAGTGLTVEATSDFQTWTQIASGTASLNGLAVTDSQPATVPDRFYRAMISSLR